MASAEFESQKTLSMIIPESVISPVPWGTLDSDGSRSFYLAPFWNLLPGPPTSTELLTVIKKLRQISESPTGKFGYHCSTYWGPAPMRNDWTDSWEEYWERHFRSDIDLAQDAHGEDHELAHLTDEFVRKLLRGFCGHCRLVGGV